MRIKRATSTLTIVSFAAIFALCFLLAGCSLIAPGSGSSQASSSSRESFSSAANDKSDDSSNIEEPQPTPSSEASSSSAAPAATPYSDALTGRFESIANSSAMNVGIAFIDLNNPDDACFVNADQPQHSASMIKLLILNELFNQVNQGLIDINEGYTLTGADIVGGTGVLQGRGAGASTTFSEMAELMISQSDNTAANVIINRLGMGAINERAGALGLTGSSLNRLMMDTDALAAGVDNYMSARDAATLLKQVFDGTFVDASASQFAMDALMNQSISAGILGGLSGGSFAHKTGSLSNAQNDAGIVLGDHPYVLSVFCDDGSAGYFSQGEAYDVMSQCGAATSEVVR